MNPPISVSERCARARQAKAAKAHKKLESQSLASSLESRFASESIVAADEALVDESLAQGFHGALVQMSWKEDMFLAAKKFLMGALSQSACEGSTSGFQVKAYISQLFSSTGPGLLASDADSAGSEFAVAKGCEDLQGPIAQFFEPYRGYCSVSQTAQEFKTTDFVISHGLIRSASALLNLSSTMRSGLMQKIHGMLDTTHTGVMIIAKFRFDETPSKIKVSDLDSSAMPGPYRQSGSSKSLAKILQTELEIACLMTLDLISVLVLRFVLPPFGLTVPGFP